MFVLYLLFLRMFVMGVVVGMYLKWIRNKTIKHLPNEKEKEELKIKLMKLNEKLNKIETKRKEKVPLYIFKEIRRKNYFYGASIIIILMMNVFSFIVTQISYHINEDQTIKDDEEILKTYKNVQIAFIVLYFIFYIPLMIELMIRIINSKVVFFFVEVSEKEFIVKWRNFFNFLIFYLDLILNIISLILYFNNISFTIIYSFGMFFTFKLLLVLILLILDIDLYTINK
jgi:hypothetical protein